jgi:hypothetical protein
MFEANFVGIFAIWPMTCVPRMYALFFHRLSIYRRATDHKFIKGCSHLGKKCGQDQV